MAIIATAVNARVRCFTETVCWLLGDQALPIAQHIALVTVNFDAELVAHTCQALSVLNDDIALAVATAQIAGEGGLHCDVMLCIANANSLTFWCIDGVRVALTQSTGLTFTVRAGGCFSQYALSGLTNVNGLALAVT